MNDTFLAIVWIVFGGGALYSFAKAEIIFGAVCLVLLLFFTSLILDAEEEANKAAQKHRAKKPPQSTESIRRQN